MNYKGLIALSSSLFLLGACSTSEPVEQTSESEESSLQSVDISSSKESISSAGSETFSSDLESMSSEESSSTEASTTPVVSDSSDHVFEGIVEEADFSNNQGYKAWTDYTTVVKEYTLGDYLAPEMGVGSTPEEIDSLMDPEIERVEVDVSDTQKMVLYRYPDKEGGEFSETSSFLAEISFYFVEDHLLLSSITPGYFSADITGAPEMDVLMSLLTVTELEKLRPEVFTVAEVMVNGKPLRQVLVSAQPLPDQTDAILNAFYFFIDGDQILHYAYLPFDNVSQDFPTSSILIYNSFFDEMASQ